MFTSLKVKITFFITLILAFTALVVMVMTHRDETARAMADARKESERNVLHLVERNVNGLYQKLGRDSGDMGRGQSLIVWAIAEGRAAAEAIDEWLMEESLLPAPVLPTTVPLT